MNNEVTTPELCSLFGVSRETLSNLAKRAIIERGEKRGTSFLYDGLTKGYRA